MLALIQWVATLKIMEEKKIIELTEEQKKFFENHAETIRAIPVKWFVRTSQQCWGAGETIKNALENANISFSTKKIWLSLVDCEWEVNTIDGSLSSRLGFHDHEGFSLQDFISPEGLLEIAARLIDHLGYQGTAEKIEEIIYKKFQESECDPRGWAEFTDKRGNTII